MNGSVTKVEDSGWIPPVDIVLEMDSDTSPAAIYADTVWTQLKNVIVIAAGDSFKAGTSGGQARIVLTSENLPSHTHSGTISQAANHSHTTESRRSVYVSGDAAFDSGVPTTSKTGGQVTATTSSAGAHTHTGTIASTGGGQAFSILNPYYAVNIWQRVG